MKTKLVVVLFALAVVAQWWIPASMILSSEKTLGNGKAFRFRTAPVDPYDAFRGKYVTLDFEAGRGERLTRDLAGMVHGDNVYAIIAEDENGFAEVAAVRKEKPEKGYYVRAEARNQFGGTLRLQFPFTKFFVGEELAEKAERLYREQNRAGKLDSYAVVRLGGDGHAVIEDLILGGIPVRELSR